MKTTLLFLIAALTAAAGTITLTPSTASPLVGSTFTITLSVTGNTDEILGFGLDTSLSTAAISLQSLAIHPFFGADLGLQPTTQVSAFAFPGNADPTVTLVTFSFFANSVGSSVVRVISDLGDPNEGLFTLASATGSDLSQQLTINVQPTSAVPEPSTFGFVALAAGGLCWRARRRA